MEELFIDLSSKHSLDFDLTGCKPLTKMEIQKTIVSQTFHGKRQKIMPKTKSDTEPFDVERMLLVRG
jgi:hypothetical protein